MEIPYSAISAEARALAAETALLVKKYGVLEEQVSRINSQFSTMYHNYHHYPLQRRKHYIV